MAQTTQPKKANLLLNLVFNILIPTLILINLSSEKYLGPELGIIVALSFPLTYGLYDYWKSREINIFSALGLVSILLTGGIGLLKLSPEHLAIKEASIPGLLGLAILISLKTRYPLIRLVIYNDKLLNLSKIEENLQHYNNKKTFERILVKASWLLAGSFFLSSILNYGLAKFIVTADGGTEEFNSQLGQMTALSYPIIAIPATLVMVLTLFYLFSNIRRLSHLKLEEIIHRRS